MLYTAHSLLIQDTQAEHSIEWHTKFMGQIQSDSFPAQFNSIKLRCEHVVCVHLHLCDQVIDEGAYVGGVAGDDHRLQLLGSPGGVQPGHQALQRRGMVMHAVRRNQLSAMP